MFSLFFDIISLFSSDISMYILDTRYNGYAVKEFVGFYVLNSSLQTRIETDNFIIDIPKFNWYKYVPKNQDAAITNHTFLGIERKVGGHGIRPHIIHLDLSEANCEDTFLKEYLSSVCNPPENYAQCSSQIYIKSDPEAVQSNKHMSKSAYKCNNPNRVIEMINGWEAEVYRCEDAGIRGLFRTAVKYKCESFTFSDYNNTLEFQYDIFFKGVRLK